MLTLSFRKPDLDDALHEHSQALGVGSVAAYKLWCYRHDLSTELDKTAEQLQAEIGRMESQQQERDPDISPHHNPSRPARPFWIAATSTPLSTTFAIKNSHLGASRNRTVPKSRAHHRIPAFA